MPSRLSRPAGLGGPAGGSAAGSGAGAITRRRRSPEALPVLHGRARVALERRRQRRPGRAVARVTARSPYLRRIRSGADGRRCRRGPRRPRTARAARAPGGWMPSPRPAGSAAVDLPPQQLQGRLEDRLGQVGRLGQRRLAGDRREARVADLDRDRRRLEPGRPQAPATPSAMPSSVRSMTSRSVVSTSNVCSWPIDFAGSPVATGSGSIPRARSTSDAPCLPKRRSSDPAAAPRGRRSSARRSRAGRRRLLADAPQPRDRQRREERRLLARRHDDQAVGLAQVRGDLGDELRRRHADRHGQPDLVVDGRP